jgi:hypothetical protein
MPSPAIASTDGAARSTDAQLHAVVLGRNRIRVCLDLFHHDCKPEIRRQVDESLAQPIHVILIHESGDGYRIRRSPALDSRVAQRYAMIREQDRGPRPYFADNLNPPLYVDGIRFEGSLDELEAGGLGVPGEEWEEWEVKEVCGHRTADDGVLEVLVRWMSGKETWELCEDVAQSEAEAFDGYERVHGWVIGNTV